LQFRFIIAAAAAFALSFGGTQRASLAFDPPAAPPSVTPAPLEAPSPAASPGPAASSPFASPASPAPTSANVTPSAPPTPPTGRRLADFKVTADRIAFYSNRYIMEADGHVVVALGDGTHIAGNTFFYDLRLNRFVIAGAVRVTAALTEVKGAAFAEYFDFDRAYFLPILSQPDRWTFVAGDYAHPRFGRLEPGDTFFLPDLSGERVFLYAKNALVDPKQSVRFTPARINFGLTFVPFPTYFLNFSANPLFAQNALTGAYADGPLDFAGGEHSLATAHVRYDSIDHAFGAFELHEVSDNSYIVVSANPITRPLKQYNLLTFDRITPGVQIQSQIQETAFQSGFSRPLSATAYANVQLTASLAHSYLRLNDNSYFDSLLARPSTFGYDNGEQVYYYDDPTHPWIPDHPSNIQLTWSGFRHQINQLPIYFQLRSEAGVDTDTITPLQQLGGVNYYKEYDKALGIDITTKNITLRADPSGRHRDIYFTALFDRQREWFSLPHHIDTQVATGSITKVFDPQVIVLASYSNTNTGDFYGAQQSSAYPGSALYFNPFTGQTLQVSPGFRGFGTVRSFAQSLVFVPSEAIAFTTNMRENDDFPRPIPGTLQIIGDGLGYLNYGVTPYELDLDVRFRISRVFLLDVSRSNYFGFGGNQRWSQQFNFQVEK